MSTAAQSATFLILRKTVYGETSLILAGLTPEDGQMHLLLRGALRLGRKQFPVADLFRLVRAEVRGGGELHPCGGMELLEDFGGVVRSLADYRAACRLAGFALANVPAGAAAPRFFTALATAFRELAGGDPGKTDAGIARIQAGVWMVFLEEQGWLPDFAEAPERARRRAELLAMGEGRGPAPDLPPAQWQKLEAWCVRQLLTHDCRLPKPD